MGASRVIALSFFSIACAGFACVASAEGISRAEVSQQLIQVGNDSSQLITDTTFPDVRQVFAQKVAHQKQREASIGGVTSSSSAAGVAYHDAPSACVGPASFCSLYFGS